MIEEYSFAEKLMEQVEAKPSLAKFYMKAIAAGLDHYEANIARERDIAAKRAFENILTADVVKRFRMPAILDAVYTFFPSGGGAGYSQSSQEAFEEFIVSCARYIRETYPNDSRGTEDLRNWIDQTRGARVLAWWQDIIEPRLAERMAEEPPWGTTAEKA